MTKILHYGFKFNSHKYSLTKGLYYVFSPIFEETQKRILDSELTYNDLKNATFNFEFGTVKCYESLVIKLIIPKKPAITTILIYKPGLDSNIMITDCDFAKKYPWASHNDLRVLHIALKTLANALYLPNPKPSCLTKVNRAIDTYRIHLRTWTKYIETQAELSNKRKYSKLPDLVKTLTNSPYDFTYLMTLKPKMSSTLDPKTLESIPCKTYIFLISGAQISLNYALDLSRLINFDLSIYNPAKLNLIQFDLLADLFRNIKYNPDLKSKFKEL